MRITKFTKERSRFVCGGSVRGIVMVRPEGVGLCAEGRLARFGFLKAVRAGLVARSATLRLVRRLRRAVWRLAEGLTVADPYLLGRFEGGVSYADGRLGVFGFLKAVCAGLVARSATLRLGRRLRRADWRLAEGLTVADPYLLGRFEGGVSYADGRLGVFGFLKAVRAGLVARSATLRLVRRLRHAEGLTPADPDGYVATGVASSSFILCASS